MLCEFYACQSAAMYRRVNASKLETDVGVGMAYVLVCETHRGKDLPNPYTLVPIASQATKTVDGV